MAILVFSPNGTYVTKPTLEAARTSADCVGKTVVVTSALTAAQSDITAAWPADRALEVKKGGSIRNTLVFTVNSSFSAGMYQVFAGTGQVALPQEPAVNVKWFGAIGDGVTDDTTAFNNALLATNSLFIPAGTFVIGDVQLFKKSIRGNGNTSTILLARSLASTVFFLQNPGDWEFTTLEKLTINGNNKLSDGVTFGNNVNGLDGRWTIRDVNLTSCNRAIYKPRGNIGNKYERLLVTNCNFGFYAIGLVSPVMHAGCDIFDACHFGGSIAVACWYINNNNVDGYGQTVITNCISEGNTGATFILKNTPASLYQGVVIDNLWTEANTQSASITIESVTYLTADYILDNAKGLVIKNSYIKSYRAINTSLLFLSDCRIDPLAGYYIVQKDTTSYVGSTSQHSYRSYSDSSIVAKQIEVNSYAPALLTNARCSIYRTSDNSSIVKLPSNKIVSTPFDVAVSLSGSAVITSTLVNTGNLYSSAGVFTIAVSGEHVLGDFTTVAGKYYVVTLTSKTTGTVAFYGDANQGALMDFVGSAAFITQKAVFYAGEVKTIAPHVLGGASGGTLTIREYQALVFDTKEEAFDYLNSQKFVG